MKNVIDYLLKNDIAEIPKRGRKELKQIIIDGRKYRYNKDKPISNILQNKLKTIKRTNEYQSYSHKKISLSLGMKKALTKYAIRNKFRVENKQSAFKNYANNLTLINKHYQGEKGLSMIQYQKTLLLEFLNNNRNMKLNIRCEGLFVKQTEERDFEILYNLPSTRFNIHNEDDLTQAIEDSVKQVLLQIEKLEASKSNLIFKKITKIAIHYDKYDPTRAGIYIDLPRFIKLKKACVNIKNKDNKCFKYCVQCVVYDKINKEHPEELYHYNKLNDDLLNWEGVQFPTGNGDIDRFEENNHSLVSINVYEVDDILNDGKVISVRTTKVREAKHHINLLRIYDDDSNNSHYVVIKNLSRLLNKQLNKNTKPKHICRHCHHPFTHEEFLNEHLEKGCIAIEGQHIKLPKKGSHIEFEKFNTKLECPFVIYGDFECLTTNSTDGIKGTYQHHKPCGFMLNVVDRINKSSTPCIYRGEDCMDKFVEQLASIKDEILERMKENKPMIISDEQELEFRNATRCSICNKHFKEEDKKVRDHCHFTGHYRGAAHEKCNLDYSFKFFKVPVFFHNLKNYDAHLIIEKANELNQELNPNKKISVIAQNSEKFITFSFGQCEFKDSFAFLSASLDKLVKLNKYDNNEKIKDWQNNFRYTNTNPYIQNKTDLDLLTEKGVYPYDYMNSFNKFNEEQLPKKENFYSHLYEEHITDKDYTRANIIWKHFNIKNLGEYHDLYLMTDVYLLTDVFENFRDMCLNYYGLDPAHYITLPNYSWNIFYIKQASALNKYIIKICMSWLRMD